MILFLWVRAGRRCSFETSLQSRRTKSPFEKSCLTSMTHEFIKVERRDRVGLITLNRPKQMNALNPQLMQELGKALHEFDAAQPAAAIVLTGTAKPLAPG